MKASCRTYVLLAAGVISLSGIAWAQDSHRSLNVGIAVPLSGGGSSIGEACLRGTAIYFEIYPEAVSRIHLHVEDIGTAEVSKGVSAVRKLIEMDRVDALVLEISSVVNATAPIIDRAKVPSIAIVGDDVAAGTQYLVKLWPPAVNEARATVRYLAEKNAKKIVILTSEQDSMLRRRAELLRILPPDIEVAMNGEISSTEDIHSAAVKTAAAQPDVTILHLMPGLAGTTARRLRELGYKNSFSGSVSLAIKNEAVIANGALRGASFTDAENSANFLKRYETKHSSYPESGAAQCHDAILLLDQALREVGMDREKINSAIRRENIVGASGSFSFKNDGQNTFDLPVTVRTIE